MKPYSHLAPLDGHQGFLPPRYDRGQRTADALLRAGRRLLRAHPLESMTVQDLCTRADVTTGAFYGRFSSKTAFFKALQAIAIDDILRGTARRLRELDARPWRLEEAVRLMTRSTRRWILRHEGVLRASITQRDGDESDWRPFQRGAQNAIDQFAERIETMLGPPAPPTRTLRIHIAFQMMLSTLVNAAINRPGPLALSDRRMDEELTRAFCAYVRAD